MINFEKISRSSFLMAAPFSLMIGVPAFGQSVVIPPSADISRLRLPPPDLPTQEDFDVTIRNPEESVVPKDVSSLDFLVSKVRVNGATYFSADQINEIFSSIEGRRVRLEELREYANQLQELYANEGFLLTRVILPPQTIEDGIVTVEVVEGFLDNIAVDDSAALGGNLAKAALSEMVGAKPLNIRELDGKILILNDTPGLSVKTLLRPGSESGAAEMAITTSRPSNQGFFSVSNTGSDAIGPVIYSVGYTVNSPFGHPAALDLSLSSAGHTLEELLAVSGRYAFPVGPDGNILYLGGLAARARPGGEAAELEVASSSYSVEARLRSPLLRNRSTAIYLETAVTFASTRVEALDTVITRDKIVSGQIGLRGQHQSDLGQTALQFVATGGIPAFGALDQSNPTPSVVDFESKFLKFDWQFDHLFPPSRSMSFLFRASGQWSDDRLLAGEQLAFGGPQLGRGYAPSSLTGDRGFGLLGELRLDFPDVYEAGVIANLQAYSFGDWAKTKLLAGEGVQAEKQSLLSYGFGLRAVVAERALLDLQFASDGRELAGIKRRPARLNLSLVQVL